MDIGDAILIAYFIAVGSLGFYLLWREWRYIRKAEEEYKAYVREITDEYMEERER